MIAKELINDSFPPLKLRDSGLKALNWMEEFRLEHLPVVDGLIYIGLVSEEDILKLSSLDQPLANHKLPLIKPFVKFNQPVFEIVKVISHDKLTVVPVIDAVGHYLGLITLNDVLKHYSESGLFDDTAGVIVLEVGVKNYSISEISHLIEEENARILSLYITPNAENETIDLTIKVNQPELSRILASFTRHGYIVKEHYHQNEFVDDMKTRYDSLMNYLGI